MKLEIHGLDDLENKLKEGADLKLVKDMLKKHATQMHQKSMRDAPVDTGALKRYIMLSVHDGGFTWRVKSLINYGSYPEYGTRYQAAQPYIRPAFYQQRTKLLNDLRKIMK